MLPQPPKYWGCKHVPLGLVGTALFFFSIFSLIPYTIFSIPDAHWAGELYNLLLKSEPREGTGMQTREKRYPCGASRWALISKCLGNKQERVSVQSPQRHACRFNAFPYLEIKNCSLGIPPPGLNSIRLDRHNTSRLSFFRVAFNICILWLLLLCWIFPFAA